MQSLLATPVGVAEGGAEVGVAPGGTGVGLVSGVATGAASGAGLAVAGGVSVGVGVIADSSGTATAGGVPSRLPNATTGMIAATTAPATTAAAAAPAIVRVGNGRDARGASSARKERRRSPSGGFHATRSARSRTLSLARMFLTWNLTASGLTPRRTAISAKVPPVRSSSRTRHSAGVRMSGCGGRPRPLRVMRTSVAPQIPIYPPPALHLRAARRGPWRWRYADVP